MTARQQAKAIRGDLTRERLLTTSIDVFGRYGFDGATTRMLTDAAGVNQQAIPYYFGSKEGLYIATAEFIAEQISVHVSPMRDKVRGRFLKADEEGRPVEVAEARALLSQIVETVAALFVSEQSEPWARFIIREQMYPTEAFRRIYDAIMSPMFDVAGRLVGILLRDDPATEHIRLRTLSLLGSILVFRMARAAVMAKLGWETIGADQLLAIQAHARELVAAIGKEGAVS
ncbi:CerR family C-terminal domain-containing protein [Microvirga sp. 2YAF29]|uniref:CerR family C-terminal domain-containing protein n=1 Tax=Microvirga sp. 2YAF29 TaxID=3233031 RepID=UPI003F9BEB63